MFGLVPKAIWSKRLPPDDRNRIAQDAHSLLVELDDGRKGLVDTGCGNPLGFSERERELQGLSDRWFLMEALGALGLRPEDIDFVVLTHLHWDHSGGCGEILADGSTRLTFPRAQHFVHVQEWDDATGGDPLLGKSYPASAVRPLADHQQDHLVLVTDAAPAILPGVRMARSGGHTRGHCVIVLQDAQGLALVHPDAARFRGVSALIFAGDVCPTQHHLRLVFQTAYDTFPLQTRRWKEEHLPAIAADQDLLLFDHDPDLFGACIAVDAKDEYRVTEILPVTA